MKECIDCGKECSGERCMECFKKTKIFCFDGLEFASKKELDIIIKQKIKLAPKNIEFVDELLLRIVNNLHPVWKNSSLKCKKFKFLTWEKQIGDFAYARDIYRGNFLVVGFFQDEEMSFWEPVTLYPHKKENQSVKHKLNLILREEWSRSARKRDDKTICENCKKHHSFVQLHHKNISFKEIAEKCIDLFTEKELETGIVLDRKNHPAVLKMNELHLNVKYKWLCPKCHKEEHKNGY
jgi:hypothetical protein